MRQWFSAERIDSGLDHVRVTKRQAETIRPNTRQDVRQWAKNCLSCQASRVHTHTRSPLACLSHPEARFRHIHVDIVEANGLVELLRQEPKSAVIAISSSLNWVERLSVLLLSIRSTEKEDFGAVRRNLYSAQP
nr:gag pol polyprotein [Hymenolepis microstoma]